jgi:hypothetical protein
MQTDDLIATAKRSGGLAAAIAAELEAMQRQLAITHTTIAGHCDRSGPEYLVDHDLQLAAWLASAAADHPRLQDPMAPLAWPVGDRRRLEELISQCFSADRAPSKKRTRAEVVALHGEIHELCYANGCGPDLADGIVLGDDDRTWRRRHLH